MSEAKVGEEFIRHEFDEAIAIQQAIVEGERTLAGTHPFPDARQAIKSCSRDDQQYLRDLQRFGRQFGATGEVEEVAGSMTELLETTLESASEADSEAYEAHAVLLSLKRKQQDAAAAMAMIARQLKDAELRDAARELERGQKKGADALADSLAVFAVQIATQQNGASA